MPETILSQRTLPWANELLAHTNLYIHAVGCFITEIAQAVGTTPDVVNEKLKAVGGFNEYGEVIWAKIAEAFPGYTATLISPYNNEAVLKNLNDGHIVLGEVGAAPIGGTGIHCITFIGNHECTDPWDGTVKPTSTFPDTRAYVVITKPQISAETPPPAQDAPVQSVGEYYQGLDITNVDSVKAAIDTWKQVEEGQYVSADEYIKFTNTVCEHLGIDSASDLTKVIETIDALKADFAKATQASVVPAPTQIEGQGPVIASPPTLQTLPQEQKETLLQHIEQTLKAFLGL